MEFKAATCPNCHGQLQIPDDKDFVNCMYCGTNIKVRDVITVEFQSNVVNLLVLARRAYNTGRYQESYAYYCKVLEFDAFNKEAIEQKALWEKAISFAIEEEDKKDTNNYYAWVIGFIVFCIIALIVISRI